MDAPLTFKDAEKMRAEILRVGPKPDPIKMGQVYAFLRKEIEAKNTEAFLPLLEFDIGEPEIEELRRLGWTINPRIRYGADSQFQQLKGWVVRLPGWHFTFEDAVKIHYPDSSKPSATEETHDPTIMKRVYETLRGAVEEDKAYFTQFSLAYVTTEAVDELRAHGWNVIDIFETEPSTTEQYLIGWNVKLPRALYEDSSR